VLGAVGPQAHFVILRETPDFIAVDKPPGVLVHPTKPGGPRTLWDELRGLLAYEVVNGGNVSILTRLDRETSGVVLVAKTATAARELSAALQAGRVQKKYLAVVFGWPQSDVWTVDAPIIRLGEVEPFRVWLRRGVHPGGDAARTGLRVLQRWKAADGSPLALLEARPQTGRTHQIRVHLASCGHPVVGDKIYARGEEWYLRFVAEGWTGEMEKVLLHSRHALHATGLEFNFAGEHFCIHSPWPEDLQPLCQPLAERPAAV